MSKKTLGQFIKTLRKERGLTQETLIQRAGISSATLSALERDLHEPQESTSASLLDALRTQKEMSREEIMFAIKNMRLPSNYSWEILESVNSLSWEYIEQHKGGGYQPWIDHCVTELTLQVGQAAMLELLLDLAKRKGLYIPESPSL